MGMETIFNACKEDGAVDDDDKAPLSHAEDHISLPPAD